MGPIGGIGFGLFDQYRVGWLVGVGVPLYGYVVSIPSSTVTIVPSFASLLYINELLKSYITL